ncbi:hypothetical protein [Aeromonas sp. 1HA1]|uniref:hypothetical protein n=1 Tax=Aeromonas sp. 1HA1 TaxID=2699193 RepID=UPI0023DDD9FC|nr:hypothetical protein [Aeromonas sp. 1HA1]MDF2415653.1 hypothetical protein [Aeromonas sp. 1HA1]
MTPAQMKQYGKGLGLWQDNELATGEPIQYLKKDDVGFVQLIKKAEGMWLGTDDECKKPVNPIENGVFVWTEIKGAGHAFVSVHESNSPFVYTYGRFGRVGNPRGAVGDGILNFFKYDDAREYYRDELYSKSARVFMINDADPAIARKYFERLWSSGVPAIPTPDMGEKTKKNGHTIDNYDVTGKNCTTHTTDGVKMAGSSVFKGGYTTNSQMRIDSEEDFAVPVSLQRYLIEKISGSSMQVVEVTAEFRKQYPNATEALPANDDVIFRALAEVASAIGKLSPYSGGSVGGILSGVSDVNN